MQYKTWSNLVASEGKQLHMTLVGAGGESEGAPNVRRGEKLAESGGQVQ